MSIRGNWEQRRVEAVSRMGEMDRRTFVRLGGASAAALIFGYGPFTESVWSQPVFPDYPLTLGISSGDPLPDGVVLWTRLVPDPLNGGGRPNKKVPVQWQVATDEGFANVAREGSTFARPELAHSVHVEVSGLNPASEYFYRFRAGRELSQVGKTKTVPAARVSIAEMNFDSFRAGSTSTVISPRTAGWPSRSSSTSSSTSGTTYKSTVPTSTSPQVGTSGRTQGLRSSRSPITATATPSTALTRISSRHARRLCRQ